MHHLTWSVVRCNFDANNVELKLHEQNGSRFDNSENLLKLTETCNIVYNASRRLFSSTVAVAEWHKLIYLLVPLKHHAIDGL